MSEKYLESKAPDDCTRCRVVKGMLITAHGCYMNGQRGAQAHAWAGGGTSCDKGKECPICNPQADRTRGPKFEALNEEVTGTRELPRPIENANLTWYRVVDFIGPESGWQAGLALMIRGDGQLVIRGGKILVFMDGQDLVQWAKEHARYVIGLEARA